MKVEVEQLAAEMGTWNEAVDAFFSALKERTQIFDHPGRLSIEIECIYDELKKKAQQMDDEYLFCIVKEFKERDIKQYIHEHEKDHKINIIKKVRNKFELRLRDAKSLTDKYY